METATARDYDLSRVALISVYREVAGRDVAKLENQETWSPKCWRTLNF